MTPGLATGLQKSIFNIDINGIQIKYPCPLRNVLDMEPRFYPFPRFNQAVASLLYLFL